MLQVESNGPVTRITLNRPEVRNALSDHLISALSQAFLNLDSGCRAVVLTGADPAFCGGGDLEWMRRASAYSEEENYQDALKLGELFYIISTCKPIVVARVNGHAFGGGAGLIAASDVAIGSTEALYSFSEVKLGLVGATISRYVIPKIGSGNARWLYSTGEAFRADVALRIGLLHEIAAPSDLDRAVNAKVAQILKVGPLAAHESKLVTQGGLPTREDEARLLARVRSGAEAREGVAAFLEKRPASFCEDLPQ